MKKILLLLFTVSVLSVACDKEPLVPDNNSPVNPTEPSDTTQIYPYTSEIIPAAVTDYDGNIYDAIKIGEQIWMASNLRTTHYADNTPIPARDSYSYTEPYRYAPGNNESNVPTYGYLYNWQAVMHGTPSSNTNPSDVQGICPTGWHVPSDAEWTQLTDYVSSHSECVCGGNNSKIAKALASTTGWQNNCEEMCTIGYNLNTNNFTGFSAFPAGGCLDYSDIDIYESFEWDDYHFFGLEAPFWSSTETSSTGAIIRKLFYNSANIFCDDGGKRAGLSVRCVKD